MKFKFLTCLLLAVLSFNACKKDTVEEVMEEVEMSETALAALAEMDENKEQRKDCFEFVYPIAFNMPDGTSISGEDEASVKENIRAWYIANPESRKRPSLALPVEIIFKDKEEVITIDKEEGLRRVYAACKGEGDDDKEEGKKCFKFVYPVSYTMPDGSTITGENEEEVNGALKDWYEANPDTEEKPALRFPVQVVFEDRDGIITIDNEEGLRRVYAACKGEGEDDKEEGKKCFNFIYPVSYTMPDGSTITGENEEEVNGALKDWYEANPDTEEEPALQFPVQVVFEDRDGIITIDNEEGLRRIYAACDDEGDSDDDNHGDCFEIVYPISYTMPDGAIISGDDARSLRAAIGEWYEAHPDNREEATLNFPIDVNFPDAGVITVEDEETLEGLRERCGG